MRLFLNALEVNMALYRRVGKDDDDFKPGPLGMVGRNHAEGRGEWRHTPRSAATTEAPGNKAEQPAPEAPVEKEP